MCRYKILSIVYMKPDDVKKAISQRKFLPLCTLSQFRGWKERCYIKL